MESARRVLSWLGVAPSARQTVAQTFLLTGGLFVVSPMRAGAMTKAQLQAKALSVSDLPAGWTEVPFIVDNPTSGATGLGYVARLFGPPPKPIKRVRVGFVNPRRPLLYETLESGPASIARYRALNHLLRRVGSRNGSLCGTAIRWKLGPMSFPRVGTTSSAYTGTLTAYGRNIGTDIVVFRVGQVVGAIVYAVSVTPDIASVQAVAITAVNRSKESHRRDTDLF